MSFCTIGNVPFERKMGPTNISGSKKLTFARHDKYRGKASSQPIGPELETFSMTIKLLAKHCNPVDSAFLNVQDAWNRLDAMADLQDPQWIILENGEVWRAKQWTLEEIGYRINQTSPLGFITDLELDLQFTEWNEERPLGIVAQEKQKKETKKKKKEKGLPTTKSTATQTEPTPLNSVEYTNEQKAQTNRVVNL